MSSDRDHASHSHGLGRSGDVQDISDARLLWAVGLNQLLTIGQVVAGVFSGSVALLSDAAHNFSDANSLLIAYIARRISRRRANQQYTFGYRRAEMIGATINLTLLAVIGLYLIYEGIKRLIEPADIIGWLMAVAAGFALLVDIATALLLWALSRGSLNMRAAFVHNLVDALGSLAVLIGAAAIIWLHWLWVDPLLTLLLAAYILWQVIRMFPQAVRVLMEGTPPGLDLNELVESVQELAGVRGLHHLHVWELDEQHRALEAHVVIDDGQADDLELIKCQIKQQLAAKYQIHHSTLEFEYAESDVNPCNDSAVIHDHS